MGEYGIRTYDNKEVKIGTCEMNYYVRWEERNNIKPNMGSEFGWFWRLPFPDEDNILEGEYGRYNKYARLNNDFVLPQTIQDAGILQLKHECGMLINIYCYHGGKLPHGTDELRTAWNGKASQFYALRYIRKKEDELFYATIGCRFCDRMWSLDLEDIVPFVVDSDLKQRLEEKYVERNKILRQAEKV